MHWMKGGVVTVVIGYILEPRAEQVGRIPTLQQPARVANQFVTVRRWCMVTFPNNRANLCSGAGGWKHVSPTYPKRCLKHHGHKGDPGMTSGLVAPVVRRPK